MFGDPNGIDILESTRELIEVEQLNMLHEKAEKSVTVYFLNDALVITERVGS